MNTYSATDVWGMPAVRNFNWQPNPLPPFGSSLPEFIPFSNIQGVIDEIERNVQASRPVVLSSTLATISTLLQGLIDVKMPTGVVSPASLILVAVAESGERKTAVDNKLEEEIRAYEKKIRKIESLSSGGVGRRKISEIEKQFSQIIKRIEVQKADEGLNLAIDQYFDAINENISEDVERGNRNLKLIYRDVTPAALIQGLYENTKYASLRSSEGLELISGRGAIKDFAKINSIWSGDPIIKSTKSGIDIVIYDARLCVYLMIQSIAFLRFMEKNGEMARSSGFLSRGLFCRPFSKQGTRFITGIPPSWEELERFNERARMFLDLNYEILYDQDRERVVVEFSRDAQERWISVANEIERQICVGGRFEGVGDHASKLADNIARVAALLECFENGIDSKVSLPALNSATDICLWFSDEFVRMFKGYPQDISDSIELDQWLEVFRNSGIRYVSKKYVLQCGPSKLRRKARLDPALFALSRNYRASLIRVGKAICLDLLPWMIHDHDRASAELLL